MASDLASPAAAQELLPAVTFRTAGVFAGEAWPGDFNEDGITDLAVRSSAGALQILIGRADGTFAPPAAVGVQGRPIGVSDLNRDGWADILAQAGSKVVAVPGAGNGSFGAPQTVMDAIATFAVASDMNNDGLRDVVLGEEGFSLHIVPGNGDFTFRPAITLVTDAWPHGGTVADFDGNGLRDVAVAHRYSRSVLVFLNGGGFLFRTTQLPIAHSSTDVTARDLNGDGRLDLAVSARGPSDDGPFWDEGLVYVYRGNGDGTFAAPTTFETGVAAHSIVAGDFTRDGRLDLATLNANHYFYDNMCGHSVGLDSLSILPGRGDGTFGGPTTFALETRNEVESLNTSDINRDGFPDLLPGFGKVLLAALPRANRAPTVDAGPDERVVGTNEVLLRGIGSDPDGHLLTFTWSDGGAGGGFNAPTADTCYSARDFSTVTLTLQADDGHGGTATDQKTVTFEPSPEPPQILVTKPVNGEVLTANVPYTIAWDASDRDGIREIDVLFAADAVNFQPIAECTNLPGTARGCTWSRPGPLTERGQILVRAVDTTGLEGGNASGRFAIRPADGGGGLPSGWQLADVGAVSAPGSANYDNGTFTVRGSGADIWGTADEFHWAYTVVTGDFDATTRVASVQNVNQWTKTGLMIRADNSAGSIHASLFATPTTVKGLAFQRRRTFGGSSVHTAGPALTAPVWLRLSRRGGTVTAFYRRAATDPWTRIGSDSIPALPATVLVGLPVSSHVDGTLATARFDNVSMTAAPAFSTSDIGAVGVAGTTTTNEEVVTLEGSGADIWGTADAFRYYYTAWSGDGTITVRVRSIEHTHAWAKAGVMFRESLAANARQVMAIVSAGKGVAMQYRAATGGLSASAGVRAGLAPEWLRLTRSGNVFTGFASEDGVTWAPIGTVTVTMGSTIYVGLPVTSHNNTTLATGQFTDLTVTR